MADAKKIIKGILVAGASNVGLAIAFDTINAQGKLNAGREASKLSGKPLLNLSCGHTSYGDINADIIEREVPNFQLIEPNAPLPFADKQFAAVYSAHTLEHVENPNALMDELERVADLVLVVLPPIWYFYTWNPAHKWIPLNQSGRDFMDNPFFNKEYSESRNDKFAGNWLVK
jgi:SAM-dependent methyltransferase